MRIIPVLDVKGGQGVRAIGGQRERYQPIQSTLCPSSDPLDIARAYRDQLGFEELYLADLDAIAGSVPAWDFYRELMRLGVRLWVDAGVRDAKTLAALQDAGVGQIILALETLPGPRSVEQILASVPPEDVTFSLDLRSGVPLARRDGWGHLDADGVARAVIGFGIQRLLLLDLTRVGMRRGPGTEALAKRIHQEHPAVELYLGGGINDLDELRELTECGVRGVLIGSAFHDGRIGPADLSQWNATRR